MKHLYANRVGRFFVAVFVAVTIAAIPEAGRAASCCGGGSASSLVLPKLGGTVVHIAADYERYDGFWDGSGVWTPDPQGSELRQFRLNIGVAYRLAPRWQASLNVPLVRNETDYPGIHSISNGLGDAAFTIRYETFEYVTCVSEIETWHDIVPAVYLGATLTIPTGTSPNDDVSNNFDITGRGFYRLEGNLLIEKTIFPWNLSVDLSYGFHFKRDVNREWGVFVEPYEKRLGERFSAGVRFGYGWDLPGEGLLSTLTLTPTVGYSYLWEGKTRYNGRSDPASGFEKQAISLSLALANCTNEWIGTLSWSHAVQEDDWGSNFPTSDTITLGVTHVFYDD